MSEQRDKITLVCTTLGKNHELLQRMLDSSKGFDETIIHYDGKFIIHSDEYKDYGTFNHQPHLTIPQAYNLLISKFVKTQWVCCMCDDDYFYPEGLAKMIEEVHEGVVAGVAHFKFHISGYVPKEDLRCLFGKKEYDLWEPRKITPQLLEKHNRLPAGSFFRKRAWELAKGFQGDKFHDWDLWQRMAKEGIEFKYFPHLVYSHVRQENSAWVQQNKR